MHPIEGHIESLRKFSLSLCNEQALADDLVQESLLKALSAWGRFEGDYESKLKSWLFTILYNSFISHCRKADNQHQNLGGCAEVVDPGLPAVFSSELLNSFNKLELDHKEVIYLVCIEGFSYKETAEVLAIPTGTVMSRLARARIALREIFQ